MNHRFETQRTDRAVDVEAWMGLFGAMAGVGGWVLLADAVEAIARTGDASAPALVGLIGAGAVTGGATALALLHAVADGEDKRSPPINTCNALRALALITIGAGVAALTLATDRASGTTASSTVPGRVMIGAALIVGGFGVALLFIWKMRRDMRSTKGGEAGWTKNDAKGAAMMEDTYRAASIPIKNHRNGQALIEMALVLMVVLVVIFGGVAAVQAIGAHYTVSQAVRVAAHQAALRGSTGGLMNDQEYPLASAPGPVAEAARTAFAGSVFAEPQYATIRVRCATNPCRRYSTITVTIRYTAEVWTPVPGLSDIRINRSATRATEQDTDN